MATITWITESEKAMIELRQTRTMKLAETDWWILKGNATQDQLDYRQALRDVPEKQTPTLKYVDGIAHLDGITWPDKPSD